MTDAQLGANAILSMYGAVESLAMKHLACWAADDSPEDHAKALQHAVAAISQELIPQLRQVSDGRVTSESLIAALTTLVAVMQG